MLEPVGHKDGFPVGGFDQVLQSVQLPIMERDHFLVLVVNCTVGHLAELVGQRSRIDGIDLLTVEGDHQLLLQSAVCFPLLVRELDPHLVHHQLRHPKVVCRLHADRDIRYGVIDLFLRAGEGLVRVDDGAVALVRGKVAIPVVGNEAPQPFAKIKEPVLGPQVHQAVAAGGPCQSDDAPDAGSHLQQGAEAFCLIALEAGQLVDDHHVVVKGQIALLDQPLHVFPVDDVHGCILHQSGFPLQLRSDCHREGQAP